MGIESPTLLGRRFRGFLPVVVDLETGGFNSKTDALLEMAAVLLEMNEDGMLSRGETHRFHVQPFPGANMEPASLAVNGIDPHHPLRPAIPEKDALDRIFNQVRKAVKQHGCTRAILVGHNSSFDLGFLNAAITRCGIKRSPFHPSSSFDTATLGGVEWGGGALDPVTRQCWPAQRLLPAWTGTKQQRTRRRMTHSERPICSAPSATSSSPCSRPDWSGKRPCAALNRQGTRSWSQPRSKP